MAISSRHVGTPRSASGVADVEQHPLRRSVALHVIPGILTAAAFYALAPTAIRAGYPAFAAAVVAGLIIVTVELGWLLREAHRRTGSWAITAVMPMRPEPFTWRKGLIVVGLLAWAFAVSALGIGGSIKDSFFTWMPGWALDPLPAAAEQGASTANVVTAVGYAAILVILAPLVEELYFRGWDCSTSCHAFSVEQISSSVLRQSLLRGPHPHRRSRPGRWLAEGGLCQLAA